MAYLILAHDANGHLPELVNALVPEGSPDIAIVHADARSPLWLKLRAEWPRDTDQVRLIRDPVAVRWGHWSLVAATAKLIDAALAVGCDYAHLLSGADWPIASRDAIVADITANLPALCHIEALPDQQSERMQTYRLDARWLQIDPIYNRLAYNAVWRLRRLSSVCDGLRAKAGLHRSKPWGDWLKGSQWWSLPADVLAQLADDLRGLMASRRLNGTLCSDEHAIQTLVAARFASRIADNRRFLLWPEDSSSPGLLGAANLPAIRASGAWFMRKVSRAHDPFFLDFKPGPLCETMAQGRAIG